MVPGGGGGGGGGGPSYTREELLSIRGGRIGQRREAACAIAKLNLLQAGDNPADVLAETISLERQETRAGDTVRKLACGRAACPTVCTLILTPEGGFKDALVTAEYQVAECPEGYPTH